MATKAKTAKEADIIHGGVFYTDGGSRGGYGGFGLHGYTYSHLPPTKGTGCQSNYLTKDGYIRKVDVNGPSSDPDDEEGFDPKTFKAKKPDEIKPLQYVNATGSFAEPTTNNVAELSGAICGLQYALDNELKAVTIITDSEYVVKGSTNWLTTWKRNCWIKSDGNLVSNMDHWMSLDSVLSTLKTNGTDVSIKWVKGHSTSYGNQEADKLATIGVMCSKDGKSSVDITTVKAEGYWSNNVDRSPFITHKRVYFTTRPGSVIPGEYFMGDNCTDIELIGKRSADGCFSYVKLATPEPVIEVMRDKQMNIAGGLDVIIMGRLDKIYEPAVSKQLLAFGGNALYTPTRDRLDLDFVDTEPVTREIRPPRLAMRAVQTVNELKGVLLAHLSSTDDNIKVTDITEILYTINEKGDYSLKDNYIVGFTAMNVDVNYGNENKKCKIEVCMGVDLPERNYLKRMDKLKPNVSIITWMESEKMFRYATVIKAGDDVGIYCGVYSNTRFLEQ